MRFQLSINQAKLKRRRFCSGLLVIAFAVSVCLFSDIIVSAVRSVLTPVYAFTGDIINHFCALGDYFKSVTYYKNENVRLAAENRELINSVDKVLMLENEVHRLRTVLGIKEQMQKAGFNTVAATVVSFSNFMFVIDKGIESGIMPGELVYSEEGIIGRIYESTVGSSVVETVLNNGFSLQSRNIRTGVVFSVEGTGGELMIMNPSSEICFGDLFEAEVDGSPTGIKLGKVSRVVLRGSETVAFLTPVDDFSKLREILVLCDLYD